MSQPGYRGLFSGQSQNHGMGYCQGQGRISRCHWHAFQISWQQVVFDGLLDVLQVDTLLLTRVLVSSEPSLSSA
ncbi:MAG: hypothetical protein R3F53_19975 [Gammaproteobacteria bacterium]